MRTMAPLAPTRSRPPCGTRLVRVAARGRRHRAACAGFDAARRGGRDPAAAAARRCDPARPFARRANDDPSPPEPPGAGERVVSPHARDRAAHAAGADRDRRSPSAQVRWHYSVVANGMAVVVPRSQLASSSVAGVTVWPCVTLPRTARPDAAADRRDGRLGPDPRDRGQGDEDRRSSTTASTRAMCSSARRASPIRPGSRREDRLHDAEGDRREDLRAGEHEVEVRENALRSRSSPSTRRTSPASPRAITTRSRPCRPRACASQVSRRRISRQLQGADRAHPRLRPRRQLARDREGDRGGGQGRDGRDQPFARRAGDRADAGHRRCRARARDPGRRRNGGRRGQLVRRGGRGGISSPANAPNAIAVAASSEGDQGRPT